MKKVKLCKFCGDTGHTQFYCRRKPRTPIRQAGTQHFRWMECRTKWLNMFGTEHLCHYCGREVTALLEEREAHPHKVMLTLDHLESRSRVPAMRYMLVNLVPACGSCNRNKGSLSHDEYVHTCHTDIPMVIS